VRFVDDPIAFAYERSPTAVPYGKAERRPYMPTRPRHGSNAIRSTTLSRHLFEKPHLVQKAACSRRPIKRFRVFH